MADAFRLCWLVFGVSLLLGGTPALCQSDTSVRVRLHHGAPVETAEVTVEQHRLGVMLPGDDSPVLRLHPGDTLSLGARQGDVSILQGDTGLYASSLRLTPLDESATWSLSSEEERTQTYTGTLSLAPDSSTNSGLLLVNHVSLEDYVASVVASEYGLDDEAGTKAMAVVARTYGLFATQKFGDNFDHADGTVSQVYGGATAVTPHSRRAAQSTRGEVLTHDGRLIQAVYFSSSGGHTANNEDVWKSDTARPYLRGRPDPYDEGSPHHTWRATVTRSTLLRTLTREHGTSVGGFTIGDRAPHGRIKTINILLSDGPRHTMNANAFRHVVNRGMTDDPLKSTWFDARRVGDAYVFEGRGYGHGVGLAQWGAHAMAQEGNSYREILSYYYSGVEVERYEGADLASPSAPIAEPPPDASTDSTSGRIGW